MNNKGCPKSRDREPPKTSKETVQRKIFKFETVDSLDSLSQADVGYNWPESPVKITIGGKKLMQQKSMQLKHNSPSNVKRFLSSPVLRATSSYIDLDKQKNRGFHRFQEEIKNEKLIIANNSYSNYCTANDDSLLHSPKHRDSDEESVESFKFDLSDFDDPPELASNKPKCVKDVYEGLDDSYNDKLLANLPMDDIIRRCTQSESKVVQVEVHISPELTQSKIVATANSKLPKHTSMPSTSITNKQLPSSTSTVINKNPDATNKPANKFQFERHASMPFGKKVPASTAISSNLKISQSKESISLSASSTSIQSSSSSSPPKCTPQEIAEKREKALITRRIRENEAKARQIRDSRMKQANK
ncbi:unnamed protein product [Diamesa hyperborea]